jgi:hypothetical protein
MTREVECFRLATLDEILDLLVLLLGGGDDDVQTLILELGEEVKDT